MSELPEGAGSSTVHSFPLRVALVPFTQTCWLGSLMVPLTVMVGCESSSAERGLIVRVRMLARMVSCCVLVFPAALLAMRVKLFVALVNDRLAAEKLPPRSTRALTICEPLLLLTV